MRGGKGARPCDTEPMDGENAKLLELLGLTQEDLEYWRQHTLLTQHDLDGWRDNLLEALESEDGLNRVLDRLYPALESRISLRRSPGHKRSRSRAWR